MKKKLILLTIATATIISFSSCYATFRTRGHRYYPVYVQPGNMGYQSVSIEAPMLQLTSPPPIINGITNIN